MTFSSFARWCLAGSLLLGGGALWAGDDWPQFRGPGQQGWAEGAKTPLEWSESKGVKWKTPLPGEGWSSPVVADGQIWMTTALDEGKSLRALCVDFATGKQVHDVEVFAPTVVPSRHRRNSYASPTPVLADGKVYVHYGTLGTACLDAKTGRKVWENLELKVDHQNGAGGGSPTLYKDKLLITCDGIDVQYEAALDAATGAIAWKTERSAIPGMAALPQDMRKAYGTPLIAKLDGRTQSLSTGATRLYSYDPETGKELWYVDYPRGFSNVPLPV
ncbi:MAG: PQQ-binding-like beta-propeller repeat protein, partial [Chthoniobacteraceae bacterium]